MIAFLKEEIFYLLDIVIEEINLFLQKERTVQLSKLNS